MSYLPPTRVESGPEHRPLRPRSGAAPCRVLDLNHGLQFVPMATVIGSTDREVCRDADVVVVSASAPMMPGRSVWIWPKPM